MVHGGQQPIVGAHVYLFAANNTGYGGKGVTPTVANASVSLLHAGATGQSDSVGAYVLTAGDGSFSITGDYTCTPGQELYLYALGGNPGSGINSAAGMMTALGACPTAGTFPANSFFWINEVTTVAAAYAFAGFASDATHVSSSGTALAKVGLANAFANVNNLVNVQNGQALATTPAGNGTVPQTEINTLADMLAACVNSASAASGSAQSSTCTTLFSNAQSDGNSGVMPTDTATAAINIAHNPSANVAGLYRLVPATPPFGPTLSTSPNNWTTRLYFAGGGLNRPLQVAIDGLGNAWIICREANGVAKFSALGAVVSGPSGYGVSTYILATALALDQLGNAWLNSSNAVFKFSNTGTPLSGPNGYNVPGAGGNGMAIDGFGNLWIGGYSSVELMKLSSSGVTLASLQYPAGGLNNPTGIAVDGSGDVWVSNFEDRLSEFTNAGVAISGVSGYTGYGLDWPNGIALDGSGSVWVSTEYSNAWKFTNAGVPLTAPAGIYGGGLAHPTSVAIDGSGNAWFMNDGNTVTEFSNAGIALSLGSGNYGGYATAPDVFGEAEGVAIDGSGDVWAVGGDDNFVAEIIGVATPVITPIAAGLPSVPTPDGSSNLGTRP